MRRRRFMQACTVVLGGALLAACGTDDSEGTPSGQPGDRDDDRAWLMPEEGDPHRRTWMAFGASAGIWGAELVPETQRALGAIARAIARFEPVSMLVRPDDMAVARDLAGPDVELIEAAIDDLWMRDTGPVFVVGAGRAAVDFNFNGWGEKQDYDNDAEVASIVAARAGVELLHTDLVLEGGGLEVDGEGTAIITESCVLNSNRNPGWKKADVEEELYRLLGIEKVIWLPGIAGRDITDGHTDFYARFVRPGVVVAGLDNDPDSFDYAVTRKHLDILRAATDVHGNTLQVEVLEGPVDVREEFANDDFAAGYINYYVCNGAVIAPEFGDAEADEAARATLARLYPDRQIVQINIDGIAAGGGGIHCTTQQEPAA
ncbi:agmatine deiminase family protein [Nocardia sp. NPDC005978]|uniref:agmatine deiminase family protein n=1 Tax=Nocardia sp. NPDC005978 TaxID=3156725 RepID=UPI0033AC6887